MGVIFWKLIKDFRASLGKLALLLLGAALSSWGISSMVYGYFMTERDFQENFEQTFPADLSITVDNYTEDLPVKLLEDEHVIDIERREMITARIRSSRNNWMPVVIWGIEDLEQMRYDQIDLLNVNKGGHFFVEKDAWIYLNSDQPSAELLFNGHSDIVTWDLDGKVHDARQAPARMEGVVYAYTSSIQKLEPYLKQGRRRLLIKTDVSSDSEALEDTAERLKKIAAEAGSSIVGTNIPTPGEHIHQGIIDGISFLQISGGVTLSLMGIILMSLILLTWIFPQLRDIGVMKALGASTKNIFKSYIAVLICIVLVGLLIGMIPGYQVGFLYSKAVAFFQNFEPVTSPLPLYIHGIVLFAGLLIPLIIGIEPVLKVSKTSVNEAMNKTFYSAQAGVLRSIQRLLSSSLSKYGLNNLFRHTGRTVLTILLLAVGIGLFMTTTNMEYSLRANLKTFAKTSRYEILLRLPAATEKSALSFLEELPYVEQYTGSNAEMVTYLPPTSGNPEQVVMRTFSPDVIIESTHASRGKIDPSCAKCVYVTGEEMSVQFEQVPLDEVVDITTSSGKVETFIFSGVIQDIVLMGTPFFRYDAEATKSFDGVLIDVNLEDASEVLDASNRIDDLFIENGINILRRSSIQRRMAGIIGHLNPTFLIIKAMGIFTIILGLFGLIIVLNLAIEERTREIGIMKSLGSPFWKISALFNFEFLFISILASIVGSLLAIPTAIALIDIVAETIIGHSVMLRSDFRLMGLGVACTLVLQILIIAIYNRFKIHKNARMLLEHNF